MELTKLVSNFTVLNNQFDFTSMYVYIYVCMYIQNAFLILENLDDSNTLLLMPNFQQIARLLNKISSLVICILRIGTMYYTSIFLVPPSKVREM